MSRARLAVRLLPVALAACWMCYAASGADEDAHTAGGENGRGRRRHRAGCAVERHGAVGRDRAHHLDLDGGEDDRLALVRVADEGPGVAPVAVIERIEKGEEGTASCRKRFTGVRLTPRQWQRS